MVACRGCYHPPAPFIRSQVGKQVYSTPDLEGAQDLVVLVFEAYLRPKQPAQCWIGMAGCGPQIGRYRPARL